MSAVARAVGTPDVLEAAVGAQGEITLGWDDGWAGDGAESSRQVGEAVGRVAIVHFAVRVCGGVSVLPTQAMEYWRSFRFSPVSFARLTVEGFSQRSYSVSNRNKVTLGCHLLGVSIQPTKSPSRNDLNRL